MSIANSFTAEQVTFLMNNLFDVLGEDFDYNLKPSKRKMALAKALGARNFDALMQRTQAADDLREPFSACYYWRKLKGHHELLDAGEAEADYRSLSNIGWDNPVDAYDPDELEKWGYSVGDIRDLVLVRESADVFSTPAEMMMGLSSQAERDRLSSLCDNHDWGVSWQVCKNRDNGLYRVILRHAPKWRVIYPTNEGPCCVNKDFCSEENAWAFVFDNPFDGHESATVIGSECREDVEYGGETSLRVCVEDEEGRMMVLDDVFSNRLTAEFYACALPVDSEPRVFDTSNREFSTRAEAVEWGKGVIRSYKTSVH